MKITKDQKFMPDHIQAQSGLLTNSLLISSDLTIQSLYNILNKNPQLINKIDKNIETFLSYAIKRSKTEVSEFLLTSPIIDLDFQDANKNSYLHMSILAQNEQISSLLIQKGINIDSVNLEGDTPLHLAFKIENDKLKNLLIENGADLSIQNLQNLTPDQVTVDKSLAYVEYIQKSNSSYIPPNSINELGKGLKLSLSNSINTNNTINNIKTTDSNKNLVNQVYTKAFVNSVNNSNLQFNLKILPSMDIIQSNNKLFSNSQTQINPKNNNGNFDKSLIKNINNNINNNYNNDNFENDQDLFELTTSFNKNLISSGFSENASINANTSNKRCNNDDVINYEDNISINNKSNNDSDIDKYEKNNTIDNNDVIDNYDDDKINVVNINLVSNNTNNNNTNSSINVTNPNVKNRYSIKGNDGEEEDDNINLIINSNMIKNSLDFNKIEKNQNNINSRNKNKNFMINQKNLNYYKNHKSQKDSTENDQILEEDDIVNLRFSKPNENNNNNNEYIKNNYKENIKDLGVDFSLSQSIKSNHDKVLYDPTLITNLKITEDKIQNTENLSNKKLISYKNLISGNAPENANANFNENESKYNPSNFEDEKFLFSFSHTKELDEMSHNNNNNLNNNNSIINNNILTEENDNKINPNSLNITNNSVILKDKLITNNKNENNNNNDKIISKKIDNINLNKNEINISNQESVKPAASIVEEHNRNTQYSNINSNNINFNKIDKKKSESLATISKLNSSCKIENINSARPAFPYNSKLSTHNKENNCKHLNKFYTSLDEKDAKILLNQIETKLSNKNRQLYDFLQCIHLEKYYPQLNLNGFDDLNLIISQTKSGIGISDNNLKEAGIIKAGDRAKILIRFQEIAKNFPFEVPRCVYHCINENSPLLNDTHIVKLNNWLKGLKLDCYLNNFVNNGYYSLELLLLQIESKQPITNEILENDIGIDKLGYRTRILNKLKEESQALCAKLKNNLLIIDNNNILRNCDCIIF